MEMDLKLRKWIFILFLGIVVSGQDITVAPTPAAAASTKGNSADGDVLVKAMMKGLMKMGQQAEGGKGDYNPVCDFECKIDSLSKKPRKPECNETAFDNIACPFYKEGNNLNCHACNTVPDCVFDNVCTEKLVESSQVSRSECPEIVENTPSTLPWPCIGQLDIIDNLYVELYTGYNLGKPVCVNRTHTGDFPTKENVGSSATVKFDATVRTCGVDLAEHGEPRCENTTKAEVDKFLAPLKLVYGPTFIVKDSKTCYMDGNRTSIENGSDRNSTGGGSPRTKSADSYYCIWTLVLGLVAILTSF